MNQAYPRKFFDELGLASQLQQLNRLKCKHEPPWYGTVCPVAWEDGKGNLASYPIPLSPDTNVRFQFQKALA